MPDVDLVPERILFHEIFAVALIVGPVLIIRRPEQDSNLGIDVDEIGRDQLAIDDNAGRDVHRLAPSIHRLVIVIANGGILERAPAAEKNTPVTDLFITGKRLVEEVEEIVM